MNYIPKQGDIIYLDLHPQIGHEQTGRRPAVVVSCNEFNRFSTVHFVCPITNTDRPNPFHVPLDERTKVTGFIMCDQGKTLDIKARNVQFAEGLPYDIMREVSDILIGIVELT